MSSVLSETSDDLIIWLGLASISCSSCHLSVSHCRTHAVCHLSLLPTLLTLELQRIKLQSKSQPTEPQSLFFGPVLKHRFSSRKQPLICKSGACRDEIHSARKLFWSTLLPKSLMCAVFTRFKRNMLIVYLCCLLYEIASRGLKRLLHLACSAPKDTNVDARDYWGRQFSRTEI